MKYAQIITFVCLCTIVAFLLPHQRPAESHAQEPAAASTGDQLLLVDLPPGQHYLKVSVAADGSMTATVVKPVRIGSTTPPEPVPVGKYGLARKAGQWVNQINVSQAERSKVAAGLAEAYRLIASQIRSGKIANVQVAKSASKDGRQLVYDTFGASNEWDRFDESFNAEFVDLNLTELSDVADAYSEVARGLSASSTTALSPELMALLRRVLMRLIERLIEDLLG